MYLTALPRGNGKPCTSNESHEGHLERNLPQLQILH